MAVEGNGMIKDPGMKGINGQAVVPRPRRRKPKKKILRKTVSVTTR